MSLFKFKKNIVYPSNKLPLTLISLEEWSLIYIKGTDSKKYLQSQLTIDINLLKKTDHMLCAHCNIHGKVWSTMRLFHYRKGYAYIERKSIADIQVTAFKKYSIFSKIVINKIDDVFLLGVAGVNVKFFLLDFLKNIPDEDFPVISENKKTIIRFQEPSERFLMILSLQDFLNFKKEIIKSNKKIFFNDSHQWLSLDIESRFPIIDEASSVKFTPHALDLEKLKAISFKKGCYYGQEKIARIFFKNSNKRGLFFLFGEGNTLPEIASLIEMQENEQWFAVGIILAVVQIKYEEIWIQAVLDKTINQDNLFRVRKYKNIFLIKKNK